MPPAQPEDSSLGPADATPVLAIAAASAAESDGVLRFTVGLSIAAGAEVTVAYKTVDGTAKAGADYQAARGRLSFQPDSAAAQQVAVRLVDDRIAEPTETLTVRLSDPQGAGLAVAAATGTVRDNDSRALAVWPPELFVTEGESTSYEVTLGSEPTAAVTVTASGAEGAELTIAPRRLVFEPARWSEPKQVTVTASQDQDSLADVPVTLEHTASGGGYDGADIAVVKVTTVEDDATTLAVTPALASEQAGRMEFAVTLNNPVDEVVVVDYATGAGGDTAIAGIDYTGTSGTLRFPPRSTAEQTVAVTVEDDRIDEDTELLTVTLRNAENAQLAGGGATLSVHGRIEDDDPLPELHIGDGSEIEGAGDAIPFEVRLGAASGRTVTVRYGTANVTATGGSDYTTASGMLKFAASTTVRTVTVPIADDQLDEREEQFTVALVAAVNATVATPSGTGTIVDNDDMPALRIGDGSLTEGTGDGTMTFAVRLGTVSGRIVTVRYETLDGTATAGADYIAASGALTFRAGAAAATISVVILDDNDDEGPETFTVALGNPIGATLADAGATGVITDDGDTPTDDELESPTGGAGPPESSIAAPPPRLSSLTVTGGGTMYPAFDAGTHHYALTCEDSPTLTVEAETEHVGAQLTLLRADAVNNVVSDTGSVRASVAVGGDHDVAIEVSADGTSTTYVVHCLPSGLPAINVLSRTDQVTDGLLLTTPRLVNPNNPIAFGAIIDNNGVPRFHLKLAPTQHAHDAANLLRHDAETYSVFKLTGTDGTREWGVEMLDQRFSVTDTVHVAAPLVDTDTHDFLVTDRGYLLASLHSTTHDFTPYGDDFSADQPVRDSVIQEVTAQGTEVFRWNSWDHRDVMQIGTDCQINHHRGDYAHINSLQIVDGDIVASFRNCNQVLRIDRSGRTGDVEWKLGGSAPPADSATEHLELVDDPAGEFCAQHHATLTGANSVVLFDNGNHCSGPRKDVPHYSRVVEYDISSGTSATYLRAFQLDMVHGPAHLHGGVTVMDNGRWMIAWGVKYSYSIPPDERIVISEVDPSDGVVHLHVNLSSPDREWSTYRAFRYPEASFRIPLNLP